MLHFVLELKLFVPCVKKSARNFTSAGREFLPLVRAFPYTETTPERTHQDIIVAYLTRALTPDERKIADSMSNSVPFPVVYEIISPIIAAAAV